MFIYILVQSTAIRTVHSSHGVHSDSQEGKINGHTQAYKNPPGPRRLVGEGQVPSSLSSTHTGISKTLPEFGLAGEFRKIRAGTQAGLRLCRLPVRPEVRLGRTYITPVANPPTESSRPSPPTGLSGPVR